MKTLYDVCGHDSDGMTLLETLESLSEARQWVKRFVRRENAGGWDCITCNAVPFNDDFEFTWDKMEGWF